MSEMMTDCKWCGQKGIPVYEKENARGYGYYGECPKCGRETVVEEVDLTQDMPKKLYSDYETERMHKETRTYHIRGTNENLNTLEHFLRHAEYLGSIGASRNILLRIDGDGFGQLQIFDANMNKLDREKYNIRERIERVELSRYV